jgi:hypothetical protein
MTLDMTETHKLLQLSIDHLADFRRRSLAPIENAASIPDQKMIPIPFFGSPSGYYDSRVKIPTVGLNPSNREFQKGAHEKNWSPRFNLESEIKESQMLLEELKRYFCFNPYSWFNSFEDVLNGCNASYGFDSSQPNRAMHIDVCSPIATSPTWSKLGVQNSSDKPQKDTSALEIEKSTKMQLTSFGNNLFIRMLGIFKPDIVIASVGWSHLEKIDEAFFDHKSDSWEIIYSKPPKTQNAKHSSQQPCVRGKRIEVDKHDFYFVNGSMRDQPFGSFSKKEKQHASEKIKEHSNLF